MKQAAGAQGGSGEAGGLATGLLQEAWGLKGAGGNETQAGGGVGGGWTTQRQQSAGWEAVPFHLGNSAQRGLSVARNVGKHGREGPLGPTLSQTRSQAGQWGSRVSLGLQMSHGRVRSGQV